MRAELQTVFYDEKQQAHRQLGIFTLLALNAVPLIGVLQFNWASFDLIFLY